MVRFSYIPEALQANAYYFSYIIRPGRMYLLTLPNILATEINLNFVLTAICSVCISMQCSNIHTFMECNYCNSDLQHEKVCK